MKREEGCNAPHFLSEVRSESVAKAAKQRKVLKRKKLDVGNKQVVEEKSHRLKRITRMRTWFHRPNHVMHRDEKEQGMLLGWFGMDAEVLKGSPCYLMVFSFPTSGFRPICSLHEMC